MIAVLVTLGVLFALCVGADIYLKRHPLKKADQKAEKFRYRGW